jgi:predicted nucleotidyltransferase/HEPN domain-containing protein
MRESLSHLPERKQEELRKITELILKVFPPGVEMIILFGSHARGDWVEDVHTEGHITYEYMSDYDILVVVDSMRKFRLKGYEDQAEDKAAKITDTPLTIIVHSAEEVNSALEEGRYFFSDIKKEGVVLHDTKNTKLARRKNLSPERRQEIAKEDFEKWFPSSRRFFEGYEFNFSKKYFEHAVFNLHQAVEHACHTLLLVFTGYKPKLHNLDKLKRRAKKFCPELADVFPAGTQEEKDLWLQLKKAYIDARYNKSYKITEAELAWLAPRVERFQSLIEKACREKLKNF